MQYLLITCSALILFAVSACKSGGLDDSKKQTTAVDSVQSYFHTDFSLVTPPGWTQEDYNFPLDFAKDLPYKGYEEARFSPFWGNGTNNEFWAYVIIWRLTDAPEFNEKTIGQALGRYYTGLARKSRPGRNIPVDSASLAKVAVTKTKTDPADDATYKASANIFDANITMSRVDINLKIHQMSCKNGKATVILYEISPKSYSNSVWQTLDTIKSQFKCAD
jgi:hypothetical protein